MRPFEAIFQPCTGQGLYAPYKTAESGLIRGAYKTGSFLRCT